MDKKTLYSLKIFEKLGTPLMNAVLRAHNKQEGNVSGEDAKQLAALLNQSVTMSQDLSKHFEPEDPDDADALKLLLASNLAPVIAENFAKTGNLLSPKDIDRVGTIYERLLSFTESFTEAKEAANRRFRLADMDPLSVSDRMVFDEDQMVLQAMQAMLPVVIRVSEYAFGRDEKTFLAEVSKKLQSRARLLAKSLFGKQDADDARLAELGILRSLSHIYASCHNAEKIRIERLSDKEREKLLKDCTVPLDNLWSMFELRAGLMMALTKNLLIENSGANETKSQAKTTEIEKPKAAAAQAPAAQEANPMAFFKKPGSAVEQPAQAREKDEDESASSDDGQSEGEKQQGSDNPMSFFAKKRAEG